MRTDTHQQQPRWQPSILLILGAPLILVIYLMSVLGLAFLLPLEAWRTRSAANRQAGRQPGAKRHHIIEIGGQAHVKRRW